MAGKDAANASQKCVCEKMRKINGDGVTGCSCKYRNLSWKAVNDRLIWGEIG